MKDQNTVIKESMQNQVNRERRQQVEGTMGPKFVQGIPVLPNANDIVKCQFCASHVPPSYPNVHQKVADSCRKFAVCLECRNHVLGVGGILDRQTHGLEKDRNLK